MRYSRRIFSLTCSWYCSMMSIVLPIRLGPEAHRLNIIMDHQVGGYGDDVNVAQATIGGPYQGKG